MSNARLRSVALAAALAAAAGCGGDQKPTAPVSGVVTHRGQPLAGGSVLFIPDPPGPSASGTIGKDGRYALTTYAAGDGAVLGSHKVMVTVTPDMAARSPEARGRGPLPPPSVPAKYSDFRRSGLTAEVRPGRNTVDLNLE